MTPSSKGVVLPVASSGMKKEDKRKVVFRRDGSTGEIIALFPELPAPNSDDPSDCLAYTPANGAYGVNFEWIMTHSAMAKPNEFGNLFAELSKQGYKLELTQRVKADVHETRAKAVVSGEGEAHEVAKQIAAATEPQQVAEEAEQHEEELTGVKGGALIPPAMPTGMVIPPAISPAMPPVTLTPPVNIPEVTPEGQTVLRPSLQVVVTPAVNLQWSCGNDGATMLATNVMFPMTVHCPACDAKYRVTPEKPYVEKID